MLRFINNKPIQQKKLGDLFRKSSDRNKDGCVNNVITNSAQYGLIPQSEFFEKDIAKAENTGNYYVIEEGDFVYNPRKSSEAPFGPFNRYNMREKGIVSPLYTCLKPIADFNEKYMLYYFSSTAWHKFVYSNGDKGARHDRVSIKSDTFMKMPIMFPNLDEQQRIADCLSGVDAIISDYENQVESMQNQKKGVTQKIFSQEVRFKDDNGKGFPEWEEYTMRDLCERIIVGLATTVTPYYREAGVPMFRNLNIRPNRLEDDDILYLDETYANKQKNKFIHSGDILTVHTGNIGWSCIVPEKYEGTLSFTTLISTVKEDIALNNYINAFLNSYIGMAQMQQLAFSGGRANLNTAEFERVVVPIPNKKEQQKIADCLSSFDMAINDLQQTAEHWKTIKKGLLQQLFDWEDVYPSPIKN